MNITSINIKLIKSETTRVRGIAIVVLDDVFAIRDIRIIEGDNGLFIAMPSVKLPNGEFRDVCHPLNAETRAIFEKSILEKYHEMQN